MDNIKVYTTSYCGYCDSAKRLLKRLNVSFEEISLDGKDELRSQLSAANRGYRTVPMIFIGENFIGGFNELKAMADQGKLTAQS